VQDNSPDFEKAFSVMVIGSYMMRS